MSLSKELVAASATPLVLSILTQGESYGYAILGRVRELSDGAMEWKDGMLYPVLHRLEQGGLVAAKWGRSESGRRRKYYSITDEGQKALERQRAEWLAVHRTLASLWEEDTCSISTAR